MAQDTVFDILSNARRRFVLYYLRETENPVDLGELAQELAAWENETSVEELTEQQRKRVYVSLYQTHIQKLAQAGLIEYDQDAASVRLADGMDQIDRYLSDDATDEAQLPWEGLYILLAVVSGILYGLVAFDVLGIAFLTEFVIGVLIAAAFTTLAAVHYVSTRWSGSESTAGALIRNR
jgi:DNA-binding transcriptional ArsR family regulator